jgi:hypothetical protein
MVARIVRTWRQCGDVAALAEWIAPIEQAMSAAPASHQTLTKAANGTKTTPAMASGLTARVWTVKDIIGLMDPERLLPSR